MTYRWDFDIAAGEDWQRLVRPFAAVTPTTPRVFMAMSDAVLEIRNSMKQLVVRMDLINRRSSFQADGSLMLHLTSAETLSIFSATSVAGTYLGLGGSEIGMTFAYDLFVTPLGGVALKLLQGYFRVNPSVTTKVTSV